MNIDKRLVAGFIVGIYIGIFAALMIDPKSSITPKIIPYENYPIVFGLMVLVAFFTIDLCKQFSKSKSKKRTQISLRCLIEILILFTLLFHLTANFLYPIATPLYQKSMTSLRNLLIRLDPTRGLILVCVVSKDLPKGHKVVSTDITYREMPIKYKPSNAFFWRDRSQLIGLHLNYDLKKGYYFYDTPYGH